MSDSQPPWHDSEPPNSGGYMGLLLSLIGIVMLFPGACAIIWVYNNPSRLLPSSPAAFFTWLFLLIGIGGAVLITMGARSGTRR